MKYLNIFLLFGPSPSKTCCIMHLDNDDKDLNHKYVLHILWHSKGSSVVCFLCSNLTERWLAIYKGGEVTLDADALHLSSKPPSVLLQWVKWLVNVQFLTTHQTREHYQYEGNSAIFFCYTSFKF